MFRSSTASLWLGVFSVFMKENRYHPKVVGLPVGPRSQVLAQMYKELSEDEKEQLAERASKTPFPKINYKLPKEGPKRLRRNPNRPLSAYVKFVEENTYLFKHLHRDERRRALTRLWNLEQMDKKRAQQKQPSKESSS